MKKKSIKSIWRYVGGKGRAQDSIQPFLNIPHKTFREIFLGGGITYLTKYKVENNWLNDLDNDVYHGWLSMRDNPNELIEHMQKFTPPTLEKYYQVKEDIRENDTIWMGFRGIYLNRTSFNGMIAGGPIGGKSPEGKKYQADACWKNPSDLFNRVRIIHEKLKDVKITKLDFEEIIKEPGEDVLMFLDPVYVGKNGLYGVGMSNDDHKRLRDLLSETEHNFLLTYNDCPEIRELYKDKDKFVILEKSWTYSMMSQSKGGCRVGEELFIMNHELHNKYLEKKEQKDKEKLKIKKVILVKTINGEDIGYKNSIIIVEKELKHYYKGLFTSYRGSSKVKVKKKNCEIIEYEQNGEVINLEKDYSNNELKETNCDECDYQINYMDENSWPNICGKCGIDMVKYKGLIEIKYKEINNLKDYEIRENMTSEEIEQEKYIKKINQEIDDYLLNE